MKPPTCSRCKTAYSVIFRENDAGGRRGPRRDYGKHPMLLRCGHTFCRPCMRKCETSEEQVKCPTCQKVTRRGPKGINPDIYTVGLMWARRLELEHQSDKIMEGDKSKPKRISTSSVDGAKAAAGPLCADCNQPASCQCDRCDCFMCNTCFASVHGKTVSLRKHKAVPLQPPKETPPEDRDGANVIEDPRSRYCASHPQFQIEYFCNQDQVPICSRCVIMGDHKGHDVQTMEDKNQESLSEMEPAMLEVRETLWRLDKAEKVVRGAMPHGQGDISMVVVDEVRQHFQELHSLLQAREEQLVDEVREAAVNTTRPFSEMVDFLQSEKTRLNKILTEAAQAMQRSVHRLVDADLMVERLRKAREVACVATVDTEALAHPVKFSTDSTLRDAIGSYGRILAPNSVQMFSLTVAGPDSPRPSPEELPPINLGPARPASLADLDDAESVTDSASVIVEGEESESIASDVLEQPRAEESETIQSGSLQLVVGQEEKIRVTHIRTPAQFYVQLATNRGELETMQRNINNHCRAMMHQGKQETLPALQAGTMVLAQFSQDKNWYRAVVTSVHQPDKAASQVVDVFFMDYGNTERVSLSKLRPIKPKFEPFSAFAHECCLHYLLPVKTQGWTRESVELMVEMTSSGAIYMKVLGKRMGSLMVDLVKPETLQECVDDQPVSLRETLILLHLAAPTVNSPLRPPVCRTKHEYISLGRQQEGDILPVVISHVETPSRFFVQNCEPTNVVYIEQLSRAMQDTYQGVNGQRYAVFCPREGQMCMAKYDKDERWYRARVIGMAGSGKFQVRFVDYGNCETVNRCSIRKMVQDYIKFPEQAIECCLADVEPTDNGQWSEEAVQWFRMTAEGQCAQLRVVEHCTRTNKVRCVLYLATQDQVLCCVNVTMGHKGLARTTGIWSQKNNFEGISIVSRKLASVMASETSMDMVMQGSLSPSSDSSISSSSSSRRTKPSQPHSACSQGTGAPSHHTKTQAAALPGRKSASPVPSRASPGPNRASPLPHNASPQAPRPSPASKTTSPEAPNTPPRHQNAKPRSPRMRPSPKKVGAARMGGDSSTPSLAKRAITLRNLHKGEPLPGDGEEDNGTAAAAEAAAMLNVGVEVVVTGYRSPAHFFIQLQEKQKELNDMMTELAAYETVAAVADRAWTVGECCVTKHSKDHRWYRAQITAITQETNSYKVLLIDYGIEDVVGGGDLRLLQKAHAGKECFSQRCHLANLVPAGSMDPTRWSSTAVDFMADQIRAKRLFVKLEGDRTEALGLPVDILVEELIPETALEPLRHHYLSLVASLQDSGLAFPRNRPRKKSSSESCEESTEGGQAEPKLPARTDPFLNGLTVTAGEAGKESSAATSPVPARQGEREREGSCGLKEEEEEEEEERVLVQPDLSIDPHPPPTSPTISIIPVHVDSQGVIYAHDRQAEAECTSLMDAVDLYAQRQAPRGRLQVKVGQVCVAHFPDDNGWYRACILEVLQGNVKVRYIDYGNTKRVDISQLKMIPPELCSQHQMAYEFKLHNLIPNTVHGMWPPVITEYMDKQLVNSRCTAVIKGDVSEVPVGVEMVLADGTSLDATLLMTGAVKKENDMEDFYQRTADISNILQYSRFWKSHSNPYFPLRAGETDSVFMGLITHMELPNLVYIQRCAGPDNELPQDLARFAQLMDDLNDPATSQHAPLQELPAAGEVCCACYSQDERWYRGLVAKTFAHNNTALVFYVDYGNSEVVTLDRLHTLPAQFQDMPAQAMRAYLNIDLPPGVARWTLAVYHAMGEAIYLRKHIVFIRATDTLTVDLFSEEQHQCGGTTLSYQTLIDKGAISVPQMFLVAENEMGESDGVDVIVESCTEEEILPTSEEEREPQEKQPEPREIEKEEEPAVKESEQEEQDKEPVPDSKEEERDGEMEPGKERDGNKLEEELPEPELKEEEKIQAVEEEREPHQTQETEQNPEKPLSEEGREKDASEEKDDVGDVSSGSNSEVD